MSMSVSVSVSILLHPNISLCNCSSLVSARSKQTLLTYPITCHTQTQSLIQTKKKNPQSNHFVILAGSVSGDEVKEELEELKEKLQRLGDAMSVIKMKLTLRTERVTMRGKNEKNMMEIMSTAIAHRLLEEHMKYHLCNPSLRINMARKVKDLKFHVEFEG